MRNGRWKQGADKFRALSGADKWMLLHAALWLALARVMLLVMPFRKLADLLSKEQGPGTGHPDSELLERISFAVGAAANNAPWRADCFPQSIAGRMLLKHHGYGSTIHIGVERIGDDELVGHAWLTCGGIVVTGGAMTDRYAEIHRLGE